MDFIDIVKEEFKTEDEVLVEYTFQISPMIAIAAFKDRTFGELKRKMVGIKKNIQRAASSVKGEALSAKEKVFAAVGEKSGSGDNATLYRLTKEQTDVLAEIYRKYGKYMVDDILKFRKNTLAPYQLIKRLVKKNKSVTSKDVHGLTREEYLAALESGRKKIENRGEKFFEKNRELNEKLARSNESIRDLEKVLSDFRNNRRVDNAILSRIYEKFDVSDEDLQGYTPEELKKAYEAIESANRVIFSMADKSRDEGLTPEEMEKAHAAIKAKSERVSGEATRAEREKEKNKVAAISSALNLVKTEKDIFYKNGKFNVALGKYFFRREILARLKPGSPNSYFSKTYETIVEEMIKKEKEYKDQIVASVITHKKKVNFTEKEALVWGNLPTAREFSGNLSDYYQKLKEEDFFQPQYIQKSEELLKAENDIETEIRRFERKLAKLVEPEDLAKLKKYRLINNMITVSELKDPDNLFKTRAEIEALRNSQEEGGETDAGGDVPDDEQEDHSRVISPEEYQRRLKELATREYDSFKELNDAKEKAKALEQKMKYQGDTEVVEELNDVLQQFLLRKEIKETELVGHKYGDANLIDINDITTLAKKIIRKNYTDSNDAKQDVNSLKELIEKYKEENPRADDNLDEVQFLLKRIEKKLASEDFSKPEEVKDEEI